MVFFDNRISSSPYFNLAVEEYFFKEVAEDSIILWQSKNAIVVGKHQNTLAEVNLPYVIENEIDIVRRLSGGGAVFHDLGNLNFTFIQSGKSEKLVDFTKFIEPIIAALAELGLQATQGKRNEILLDGKKISGNAEHTFKNRVLHHGTLLFDTNLSTLVKSLRVNPLKFQDKAIKSVQSRVCNIKEYLPDCDFSAFRDHLVASLQQQFGIESLFEPSLEIINAIEKLKQEKYRSWEWNFGYSPSYELTKTLEIDEKELELYVLVKKGVIDDIKLINGRHELLENLCTHLKGKTHKIDTVKEICLQNNFYQFLEFF